MAVTKADFDAKFAELGSALTELSADLADLITKIQSGGLSETEEADVLNQLSAGVANLQSLAAQWTPAPPTP